jgi:EPS-associated MarR family transcriptional regulator
VNQGRVDTEAHYRVLRALEANPNLSQRQLATELGISVGKANYCIKALIDKGWVKSRNFRNSDNKLAYAYLLTPSGIRRKTRLTMRFLENKRFEFEALRREIAVLSAELDRNGMNDS